MGFFDKIKQGLTKTRDALSESWNDLFSEDTELDEDFYDELEESLILADMGVETAAKATQKLRKAVRDQDITRAGPGQVCPAGDPAPAWSAWETPAWTCPPSPAVILVIGVNGVGKTTTIGKLAKQLR